MKFFLGLCVAISTMLFPTQEPQKSELQRQPVERDREIVIQNLPDLSGGWHLYGASEKDIPPPGKRRDFKFKRVDKSTDPNEEEERAGAGLYTVIVITESGKEAPLHEARFKGQNFLIRTRIVKGSDGRRVELPGLVMKGVGDHFEGYWTYPDGRQFGSLLKLVKSKPQPKDITK
jgi:hypothetical protein